jgi:hypothetical protein
MPLREPQPSSCAGLKANESLASFAVNDAGKNKEPRVRSGRVILN